MLAVVAGVDHWCRSGCWLLSTPLVLLLSLVTLLFRVLAATVSITVNICITRCLERSSAADSEREDLVVRLRAAAEEAAELKGRVNYADSLRVSQVQQQNTLPHSHSLLARQANSDLCRLQYTMCMCMYIPLQSRFNFVFFFSPETHLFPLRSRFFRKINVSSMHINSLLVVERATGAGN